MRSNSKRVDGNRRESGSDGDLVEATSLFSCRHEGHDQSSRTLSTADECFAVVPMCQEWRPNARIGETELEDTLRRSGFVHRPSFLQVHMHSLQASDEI